MASSTDSSTAVDDEVRQLYERYQAAESDEERREIALEMGKQTDAATLRFTPHSKTSETDWC
ncbi:hypothetical protein ACFQER_10585 [Halomicroarcula sp. GCM10025894]|uniref:hypothetical protein n=1 Tax=Halomicroarcula sp. GCM10025894 TaxID=3252673 RepID=UPI003605D35D